NAITKAFDDVGVKVDARTKSYYLLSYCSPSRAGKHEVRSEAVVKNGPNDSEQSGSLTDAFDATGFMPGCDPNTPPSFDVTRGDALAPPPPPDKDKDKKNDVKAHVTVKAASPPPPTAKPDPAPAPLPTPAQQDFTP